MSSRVRNHVVKSGDRPRIGVFVSFSGTGGVERMVLNLCEGLVALGCRVDLLQVKARSKHLEQLPALVHIRKLKAEHTLTSLPALVRYLKTERPDALLAAKDRANQIAVLAKKTAGVPTRVVVRMGTNVSAALAGKNRWRKLFWYLPMRLIYRSADAVVAVSQGVARDMARITGRPASDIRIIRNPVITPRIFRLAREPAPHPWLVKGGEPVIVGIGRLTRQKDFPTLIRAFAAVRKKLPCRLIILGEGKDRDDLEHLAKRLSQSEQIAMPGFVENPYAYLKRAAMFVLSSAWEGSPNALTEALALGVPVVATNCPSGPREILKDGTIGRLVPVGDSDALAEAMLATLSSPPDETLLKSAVREYTAEVSSLRYLHLLLGRTVP
jgi:glycosyltransferase involved in cell wall biosynthesis